MTDTPDTPAFSPAELAALDLIIAQMQQQDLELGKPQPLTTAVVRVVARAAVATAAGLCWRVPGDEEKLSTIEELAGQLESTASLENLLELRRRAMEAKG